MAKHRGAQGMSGFTLIELLVAISILAIVAVLGWRGLDSIVRTRVALNNELEHTRGMQLTFAQMQSDCENIVSSFTGRNTRLAGDTDRLTLIRTVSPENQPSRMQVVAYRVKDGILSRRESTATRDFSLLDSLWQSTVNDNDSAPSVILQAGVDNMSSRLWDGTAGPWRASSLPKTTNTIDTGLAVEVKLRGSEAGIVKIFLLGAL